jgi:hypothetical protein
VIQPPLGVTVGRRAAREWPAQESWLRDVYPPEVAWNLPLSFSRLSPQPLAQFFRWLRGEAQENWSARRGGEPLGFLSWEPVRGTSDTLWLASSPDREHEAILALLPHARSALAKRNRPLGVNYPAGRGDAAFRQAGFANHQTLVWMSIDLNEGNPT